MGGDKKTEGEVVGQVRKTLYVIVPEIILNARGLGSDL